MEAMAPLMRVKFICIIFCFQSIGNLISGLLAYLIRDWSTLQLTMFVPLSLTFLTYL